MNSAQHPQSQTPSQQEMGAPLHIVFNAMSTRPGGGLTILLGILKGLTTQQDFAFKATVVCSAQGTREGIEKQGIATVVQPLKDAGGIKRQYWITRSMGKYIGDLDADILLSMNQYINSVKCPQVVYHVNLLRFMPVDPKASFKEKIFEHLRNYSARAALKKCAANVFESEYIRETAAKVYQSKNPNDQVIYIGLPDNLAQSKPNDVPTDYVNTQLMSITNGNPHKDNTTLMNLVAQLVELRPDVDWKLKIAGGLFNDLWEKYRQQATDLGVVDRIEWLGFLQQDQLTELLHESMCLVLTSQVESFCMVALESMARGCPSIVADCASMPESVGDASILVPPGDATAFAKAAIEFHDSREKRSDYSDRGFKHIERFRWETCGREFAELFTKLARAKS